MPEQVSVGGSSTRTAALVASVLAVATLAPVLARQQTLTPVTTTRGVVVAGHPEAAAAGAAVLRAGGNAMDAAVTVSLALGVAEPYASGLGGRIIVLYYDAAARRTRVVYGVEQVSRALDVEAYRRLPVAARSEGGTAVCVPGLPAALYEAHRQWGSRPWRELVRPAIEMASAGATILPLNVRFFEAQEAKLRRYPEAARLYLPDGRLPTPGTRLANPDLARTLSLFSERGPDGFYRGPVAAAIVEAVNKAGGTLTLEDMANYRPASSDPVSFTYNTNQASPGVSTDYQIESSPPPFTGGTIVELTLLGLQGERWPGARLRDPPSLDLFGRTVQQVYPIVQANVGDVPDRAERFGRIVSPGAIEQLKARVRATAGRPPTTSGNDAEAESSTGSTTHFLVVDARGNIATVTQSTGYHFGSGIVAPGTGVSLNNWMNSLTYTDSSSPNLIARGKQGRSTTAPTIVFNRGRPLLALGVPGAQRIPIAIAQVLVDVLQFGRTPGEAIGDVRFHVVRPSSLREPRNSFEFEDGVDAAVLLGLRQLGWQTTRVTDVEHFGGVNAVEITRDGLRCWADPRRTNACVAE